MSSLPFAALAQDSGFRRDPRFGSPAPPAPPRAEDQLVRAFAEGHAAGRAEALAEAEEHAAADEAARGRLELALARLDAEQAEALRQRLYATVQALCEAALAPLALDPEALAARVTRAAAMLARADDDRLLRLHPADLALIAPRLPEGLATLADPALERGALRIEAGNGGVEDGPAHWHRAIAEALAQC